MELLNNQEKELLAKYNQYLPDHKNKEPIKYSDIFLGNLAPDIQPQKSDYTKIQNPKLSIKTSSGTKRELFKSLIADLNNSQSRSKENVFKNGALYQENQKNKQEEIRSSKETVTQPLITHKSSSEKPQKQTRQQSALSIELSNKKKKKITKKQEPNVVTKNSIEVQQLFNEKLLESIDRLVKMKKIDIKFFEMLLKKHLEECPSYGQRLKQEIKQILNQLQ